MNAQPAETENCGRLKSSEHFSTQDIHFLLDVYRSIKVGTEKLKNEM
jgi:hypothetical protein